MGSKMLAVLLLVCASVVAHAAGLQSLYSSATGESLQFMGDSSSFKYFPRKSANCTSCFSFVKLGALSELDAYGQPIMSHVLPDLSRMTPELTSGRRVSGDAEYDYVTMTFSSGPALAAALTAQTCPTLENILGRAYQMGITQDSQPVAGLSMQPSRVTAVESGLLPANVALSGPANAAAVNVATADSDAASSGRRLTGAVAAGAPAAPAAPALADVWLTAPDCKSKPTTVSQDKLGRGWGFEGNKSCAVRSAPPIPTTAPLAAAAAAAAPTPAADPAPTPPSAAYRMATSSAALTHHSAAQHLGAAPAVPVSLPALAPPVARPVAPLTTPAVAPLSAQPVAPATTPPIAPHVALATTPATAPPIAPATATAVASAIAPETAPAVAQAVAPQQTSGPIFVEAVGQPYLKVTFMFGFTSNRTFPYGKGNTITAPAGSIKWTLEADNWPFCSPYNTLKLELVAVTSSKNNQAQFVLSNSDVTEGDGDAESTDATQISYPAVRRLQAAAQFSENYGASFFEPEKPAASKRAAAGLPSGPLAGTLPGLPGLMAMGLLQDRLPAKKLNRAKVLVGPGLAAEIDLPTFAFSGPDFTGLSNVSTVLASNNTDGAARFSLTFGYFTTGLFYETVMYFSSPLDMNVAAELGALPPGTALAATGCSAGDRDCAARAGRRYAAGKSADVPSGGVLGHTGSLLMSCLLVLLMQ